MALSDQKIILYGIARLVVLEGMLLQLYGSHFMVRWVLSHFRDVTWVILYGSFRLGLLSWKTVRALNRDTWTGMATADGIFYEARRLMNAQVIMSRKSLLDIANIQP